MRNKKRNRILFLLILLLGIGIGFAALATTLKINGSATITKNTWNIYWDNIDNQKGVTPTTSEIVDENTNNKKNIVNFGVTFNQPGEYYEFTVDAVNAGTLDAEIISIAKKYNGTTIPAVEDPNNRVVPAYLKYEVTYDDGTTPEVGNKLVKAPDLTSNPQVLTRKTYKVRVEYDRDAVTNTDINTQVGNLECTFTLEVQYGQANEPTSPWILPREKTANTLAVGDELCLGDQCFNFIRYDGADAVMLAKWNLNVGDNTKGGTETFKQDSDVKGRMFDEPNYGTVAFSYTYYWNKDTYPADVYDNSLVTAPDFSVSGYSTTGYSIAYYVEAYKDILESNTYNGTIKDARLITYSEVVNNIGCDPSTHECPTTGNTAFILNTSFWTGSATDNYNLWYVYGENYFGDGRNFPYTTDFGVRPVIIVSKSNL